MSDISVVIPHYNGGEKFKNVYNSVINQELKPKEIIIVDDCSSDVSFLKELESNHNNSMIYLRVIYLDKNMGPSVARNTGIRGARCKYVAFLDSDDCWYPEKLKIQYEIMEKNNLDFTFHLYSPFSDCLDYSDYSLKRKSLYSLAFKQVICTPTVMVSRLKIVEFDLSFRYCEDFLCWVLSNNQKYFYYIDTVLAHGFKNQYGESGLSANMKMMHISFLQVCKVLYDKGNINFINFLFFIFFEHIKYPLRLLKVHLLKVKKG